MQLQFFRKMQKLNLAGVQVFFFFFFAFSTHNLVVLLVRPQVSFST